MPEHVYKALRDIFAVTLSDEVIRMLLSNEQIVRMKHYTRVNRMAATSRSMEFPGLTFVWTGSLALIGQGRTVPVPGQCRTGPVSVTESLTPTSQSATGQTGTHKQQLVGAAWDRAPCAWIPCLPNGGKSNPSPVHEISL
ncbi:hypothetical protein PoB_004968600 [Plakobranchus ocellatus]|uniref:Uncharacterized protein n=1 Tax=Plakobranchus ocellatus TaxID=259542 RepID=A0AAV4BRS8_9GAST|nr:hypothetical protein PoB_004968600 [Plakobranchus ocellatus]